jgi:hypothetical protein
MMKHRGRFHLEMGRPLQQAEQLVESGTTLEMSKLAENALRSQGDNILG